MKKFIAAMRDLKSRKEILKSKLVWNPQNNKWLVTTIFSKSYIEFQGLEVIHELKLVK
jgi:hypothetical protein